MDIRDRLRKSQTFAKAQGFVAGFLTFYEGDQEVKIANGVILFNSNCCKVENIPANELGEPDESDISGRFQAITEYALRNGFAAGFPTFRETIRRGNLTYGAVLIDSSVAESREIPVSQVGEA